MTLFQYVDSLGLPPEQAEGLRTALKKDAFYRGVLIKAGILPRTIQPIMRSMDLDEVNMDEEALMIEKARTEFADFIRTQGGKGGGKG